MARIEVQSIRSRTRIRYGSGRQRQVSVPPGEGIEFVDEEPTEKPVIVQPVDPGGPVVLLRADGIANADLDELISHGRRHGRRLVLSIDDVDDLDLDEVRPLAERAAAENVAIVIRVGDR